MKRSEPGRAGSGLAFFLLGVFHWLMQSCRRKMRAFSLVEVLAIMAVVTLAAWIFMPAYARARDRARRIHCTSNLKQIGLAAKTWALDRTNLFPVQVNAALGGARELVQTGNVASGFVVMSNELSTPAILVCAADRERSRARTFTGVGPGHLSYFIGLDSREDYPQTFLAGDRNVTNSTGVTRGLFLATTNDPVGYTEKVHKFNGNLCLADGSVQQMSSARLRVSVGETGFVTNRLMLP